MGESKIGGATGRGEAPPKSKNKNFSKSPPKSLQKIPHHLRLLGNPPTLPQLSSCLFYTISDSPMPLAAQAESFLRHTRGLSSASSVKREDFGGCALSERLLFGHFRNQRGKIEWHQMPSLQLRRIERSSEQVTAAASEQTRERRNGVYMRLTHPKGQVSVCVEIKSAR